MDCTHAMMERECTLQVELLRRGYWRLRFVSTARHGSCDTSKDEQQDQQQDQDKDEDGDAAARPTVLVFANDPADLLHARLQFTADTVGNRVDVVKHLALLLELAAHVVSLLAQVSDGAEDTIESFVLFVHHFKLTLLLELSIVVLVLERVGVRQGSASGRIVNRLLQGGVHLVNFVADIANEIAAALDLVDLETEAIGVMLDCADTLDQILEVLAQVLQRLLELGAGLAKLGTGCGKGRGSDTQVRLEQRAGCVEGGQDVPGGC
jgi:hypothetical protein